MAEDDTSTKTGGTSGTGEPDATPESPAGAAPQPESGADDEALSSGDDSVRPAIGGGSGVSATGSSAAQSGRATSEGGSREPSPPDPGDPGGMGGVRAPATANRGRPPGGVSPIENEDREKQES